MNALTMLHDSARAQNTGGALDTCPCGERFIASSVTRKFCALCLLKNDVRVAEELAKS